MCNLEKLEDGHCKLGADIVKYLTMVTTMTMVKMVMLVMMILLVTIS